MLFGEKELYKQTCALKRGELKLPPPLEGLRSRLERRLGIHIVNVVYDKIDIGPAKGKPRLNVIAETQADLKRIRNNLFDYKPEACEVIFDEFQAAASVAGWDSHKPHLISDDFSAEAMNQAAFEFFRIDRKKVLKLHASHRVWNITGMSKDIVVFFMDEESKAAATSNGAAEQIKQSCYDAVKTYDEFDYITPENFSLVFDSKENLDKKYQGNLFYYFR
ncbi:MAG: hypothetical protein HOP33_09385 [Verrucomicrobia bacterium]|nr:hypothetical protein [Verrucomicrobiota bacterium]